MKLFITPKGGDADSLYEGIKAMIRGVAADLWRVGRDDRIQLKIDNAAPLSKSYCEQFFEREKDELSVNRNHLILVYVDLDPSCDRDNEDLARYASE